MEKDLLAMSKKLADSPGMLMPECQGKCFLCEFKRSSKRIERISSFRDSPEKLESAMNKGDQMSRAYAAAVSLSRAGKVPYLGVMKTPMGEVSFAVRGKVEKDRLIGVQHFDDPQIRLLAYWKTAAKKDLHIYSLADSLVCCRGEPQAPPSYVEEMLDSSPYDLDETNACPHPSSEVTLRLKWISPKVNICICQQCASDVNMVHHLASRIAARDPTDDFDVELSYSLVSKGREECQVKGTGLSQELKDKYLKGQITDRALLNLYLEERAKQIKKENERLYIIGHDCYGSDRESFLENVRGSDLEKEVLASLLSSSNISIVTSSDQAANIISELWSEFGDEMLSKVASGDTIEALKARNVDQSPSQMLHEARRMERSKGTESKLPKYSHLGAVGKVADQLARTYKLEGKEAVVRAIDKSKGQDHRQRSVSFAFLSSLGETQSKAWMFSKEEMDFGTYLKDFASKLLGSEGQEYDEALRLLVTASGSTEEVR
jgi:hypothetical protein